MNMSGDYWSEREKIEVRGGRGQHEINEKWLLMSCIAATELRVVTLTEP